MIDVAREKVERVVKKLVKEVTEAVGVKMKVDNDACPGTEIASTILFTLTPRIESELGITLPLNCYPFHDRRSQRQLSIAEATEKIIKMATNGN